MVVEDTKAVFDIFYNTWLDTYISSEHGIQKEDIDAFFETQNTADMQFESNETVLRIVAIENEKVIATSKSSISPKNPETIYIRTLYVDPNHQRKGAGKRMLEEIQKHFNKNKTFLETASYNEKAITFYTKNGFTVTKDWSDTFALPNGKTIPLVRLTNY